jgi:hypothetical protein
MVIDFQFNWFTVKHLPTSKAEVDAHHDLVTKARIQGINLKPVLDPLVDFLSQGDGRYIYHLAKQASLQRARYTKQCHQLTPPPTGTSVPHFLAVWGSLTAGMQPEYRVEAKRDKDLQELVVTFELKNRWRGLNSGSRQIIPGGLKGGSKGSERRG